MIETKDGKKVGTPSEGGGQGNSVNLGARGNSSRKPTVAVPRFGRGRGRAGSPRR